MINMLQANTYDEDIITELSVHQHILKDTIRSHLNKVSCLLVISLLYIEESFEHNFLVLSIS